MVDTIESFVSKLKSDGVQAAQAQAADILDDARAEAQKIVDDAKAQAEKIAADAKTQADVTIEHGKTELALAARDALLKLRSSLQDALQAAVTGPVRDSVSDTEFLKRLIEDIVKRYMDANIASGGAVSIDVSKDMADDLGAWAAQKLKSLTSDKDGKVILETSLRQAGFELNVTGETLEFTEASVLSILMEMVGPSLRDLMAKK